MYVNEKKNSKHFAPGNSHESFFLKKRKLVIKGHSSLGWLLCLLHNRKVQ